jgi:cell division protein ZapA
MTANTLDIKLLGKDYRVACPPEERESLQEAVALLDERMGEMAAKSKSTGERLAVMTALNLAHELLSQKNPGSSVDRHDLKRRIGAMEARLDEAMKDAAQQEKLF